MKNLLVYISLSMLLFFSCQKDSNKEEQKSNEEITSTFDSTALKTSAIDSNEDQSFYFRYRFIPGASFKYRLTTISQMERNVTTDTSMSDKLNQTIIFIMDFKTLSIDTDSIAELQCTFSSINLKANANGVDISYQSGSSKDSIEIKKFPEYESFLNNPFNIRVGKHGEIIEIFKFDKIANKFFELRGLADSLTAQEKVLAQQDMAKGSVKPLLTQIFREVPSHKMATDSTWSYKRESLPVMVFRVDYENKYKVEKLEMYSNEKLAVIDGTITTKVTGTENITEKGINYNFDKPKSTADGKIYFNLDKGLIQKSRTQTKMVNGYRMEMPSPQGTKKASAKEITSNVNVLELL